MQKYGSSNCSENVELKSIAARRIFAYFFQFKVQKMFFLMFSSLCKFIGFEDLEYFSTTL